jgi:hypothetical protein
VIGSFVAKSDNLVERKRRKFRRCLRPRLVTRASQHAVRLRQFPMSEGREMIDEIEAAGAAQDLLDAAFDVDEIWATIAEGLIERILIFPKQ